MTRIGMTLTGIKEEILYFLLMMKTEGNSANLARLKTENKAISANLNLLWKTHLTTEITFLLPEMKTFNFKTGNKKHTN